MEWKGMIREKIMSANSCVCVLQFVPNVRGRSAFNPFYKQKFIYTARRGFEDDPCVVKYNLMEAHKLKGLLDVVLDQIAKCESRYELIDFFKGDHIRANEKMDYKDKKRFWDRPDLEMFFVTVRVTYNATHCDYILHLLNRVAPHISALHDNWPGPYIMIYGTKGITMYRNFLQEELQGSESA